MPHIFWYICLIVISVVIWLITFLKQKERATLITCYLFSTIIAFFSEFFVLYLFKAYIYQPGVFVINTFRDIAFGHIITNMTILPAVTTMIVGFSLRYRWLFLISFIYMLIDALFVKVGVYKHNWWNSYLTFIALFAYCALIKVWFMKLIEKRNKYQQYLTLYLIATVLIFAANFTQFVFMNKIDFVWREQGLAALVLPKIGQGLGVGIFYFVYIGSRALIYMTFVSTLRKWYWKVAPIIIMGLIDYILMLKKALIFKNGWNLIYFSFIHLIYFTIFILVKRYLRKKDHNLV